MRTPNFSLVSVALVAILLFRQKTPPGQDNENPTPVSVALVAILLFRLCIGHATSSSYIRFQSPWWRFFFLDCVKEDDPGNSGKRFQSPWWRFFFLDRNIWCSHHCDGSAFVIIVLYTSKFVFQIDQNVFNMAVFLFFARLSCFGDGEYLATGTGSTSPNRPHSGPKINSLPAPVGVC